MNKNSRPYFSVCAIFKNEALNLREWLDHYFNRGANKIYLINDSSSDVFWPVIENHKRYGDIVIFENDIPKIHDRQTIAYNKFFYPVKSISDWTLICDLDEFVYSPESKDLFSILQQFSDYDCIFANWVMFSSNKNINHPTSIIDSCTRRMEYGQIVHQRINGINLTSATDATKYFIKNSCQAQNLWVHKPTHGNIKDINLSYASDLEILLINHYATQSRQFWEQSKMIRGDVNCHHPDNARDWNYFESLDFGDIIDTRLKDQNNDQCK